MTDVVVVAGGRGTRGGGGGGGGTGVAEGGQVHDSPFFDVGLLYNAKPFRWVLAMYGSTCNSKAGTGSMQRRSRIEATTVVVLTGGIHGVKKSLTNFHEHCKQA